LLPLNFCAEMRSLMALGWAGKAMQKTAKPFRKAGPKAVAAVSAARKAAFTILLSVESGSSHSDDLLRGRALKELSAADRNLATTLVLGVLRWQIRLDYQIRALLSRPNARLDPEVRIALRLGAFQLHHLDRIPARAAIDESVEVAKLAGHRFAAGMVNAVLRKLAASPRHEFSEDSATGLALADAHPVWLVERWVQFFGLDAARAICRHGQSQPAITVRLAIPDVEAELAAEGVQLEPGELIPTARTVLKGDVTATAAFAEGRVRLQDEGSQLVAELAGAVRNDRAARILDCCAAPGGKTLILAERNPESRIVACENSAPRLAELRERLAHLGTRVECRLADATTPDETDTYDVVLADVPCSGTGTMGRNPEIRHRLQPEDLKRQSARQQAILAAALRSLCPGGRLIYSTCSLEPEENEQVVAAVIAKTPNARVVSLDSRLNELLEQKILVPSAAERLHRSITAEGFLHLLPGPFHTDGFFIAMLERTVE
jgi:16S rRNA (cytosine967-C5)-methyltransferase